MFLEDVIHEFCMKGVFLKIHIENKKYYKVFKHKEHIKMTQIIGYDEYTCTFWLNEEHSVDHVLNDACHSSTVLDYLYML